MNMARWALTASAGLALASCGGGGGGGDGPTPAPPPAPTPTPTPTPSPPLPPGPPPRSIEREIAPAQTSAGINTALSPHFSINPSPAVAPAARLFVMLPGTGAIPRFYREIVRTGAARGYHAIGLTYPNDVAVGDRCAQNPDPDCAGKVRREVITGEDTSSLLAVDRANAIVGRLIALLSYLNANFPDEGWGQYLINSQPDWARITVAGHSQGGGHAAYFAKLFALDRTVMFSSPGDIGLTAGTPAQWLGLPNLTPASRQYGFTHTADELVPFQLILSNWRALGLDQFGPVVSVDGSTPPYANSHQLSTSAPPNPNPPGPVVAPNHAAPVVDAATPPTPTGELLYRPVWIALAFPS